MEVSINLSDSQIVQITLYNLLGQPVKELFNDRLNAGFNSFDLDIKDMVKTSYILVYQSKNNRATKKILIQ
jgi:hypothetical protein